MAMHFTPLYGIGHCFPLQIYGSGHPPLICHIELKIVYYSSEKIVYYSSNHHQFAIFQCPFPIPWYIASHNNFYTTSHNNFYTTGVGRPPLSKSTLVPSVRPLCNLQHTTILLLKEAGHFSFLQVYHFTVSYELVLDCIGH
jgi:hypothetical protein